MRFSAWVVRFRRFTLLRDASFIFSAQLASALTLFASSVILARLWGPADFGVLTALFGLASIVIGLSDLGVKVTLGRLVGKHAMPDPELALFMLGAALLLEIGLGLLIVLVAVLGAPWIVDTLFHSQEYVWSVRYILFGAAMLSIGAYVPAILQAYEQFRLMATLSVIGMVLRTGAMIGLSVYLQTIEGVAFAYMAASTVSTVIGLGIVLWIYHPHLGLNYIHWRKATREFFHFGKWVAFTVMLTTLLARLDLILLSTLSDSIQVATFGVAVQMTMIAPLAINTLSTVLLPRATSIESDLNLRVYLKHGLSLASLAAVGFISLFLLAGFLVPFFYGDAFASAVPVLQILLVAYTITVLAWPFTLLVYRLDRPDILSKVSIGQLAILLIGNWLLIPHLGALAPAIVFMLFTLVGIGSIGLWLGLTRQRRARERRSALNEALQ